MDNSGVFGLKCGDEYKVKFNFSGSYPSWSGKRVVKFAERMNKVNGWEVLKEKCEKIKLFDDQIDTTASQQKKYARYTDSKVTGRGEGVKDWYVLQRKLQDGNLFEEIYAGYVTEMEDGSDYLRSGSYAYIIDLDNKILDFYGGHQQGLMKGERFGKCGSVPLSNIPTDWAEKFFPECLIDDHCYKEKCKDQICIKDKD